MIKGRAEFLTKEQIPEKVDIIISEWMGYGLLYEGMFNSIIAVRDTFKPTTILPGYCNIYVSAFSDPIGYFHTADSWNSPEYLFGVNMPSMRTAALKEAHVDYVDPK